jgi:2-methylisocitrate lyase-like PEP mutase family enzyme
MQHRIASIEVSASTGFMAPLHSHRADETVHVLQGRLTVYAGAEAVQVGPGETFVVRRGLAHTYRAEAGARSVFSTLTLSAGRYESFLRAVGPVAADGTWSTPEDAATVTALATAAEVSLYGPPGMLPPAIQQARAA